MYFRPSFLVTAAILAAPSFAGSQTCFTGLFPTSSTNWSQDAQVPQFDPSLGTLTGITVSFDGRIEGSVGIESLDASPSIATTSFSANLVLFDSANNPLLSLTPGANFIDPLSAFDGMIDFAGTSGTFHGGIVIQESGSVSVALTPANLALFVGGGSVPFSATAVGASIVTGPGNVVSQITTLAGASVTVCYAFARPDCDGDGIADADEIAGGAADLYGPNTCAPDGIPDICQPGPDCDSDGLPDRCEADTDNNGIPDDCDVSGTEGCTPGYWKNHASAWGVTGYSPSDDFDTIFGVNAFTRDITLMRALNLGGGGLNALARHAVAALLSASHPDVDYPLTPAEVIAIVQNAIATGDYETAKDLLASYNELGCPL